MSCYHSFVCVKLVIRFKRPCMSFYGVVTRPYKVKTSFCAFEQNFIRFVITWACVCLCVYVCLRRSVMFFTFCHCQNYILVLLNSFSFNVDRMDWQRHRPVAACLSFFFIYLFAHTNDCSMHLQADIFRLQCSRHFYDKFGTTQ